MAERVSSSRSRQSARWKDDLVQGRDGTPKALIANALGALRSAPEWKGILGFNEFAQAAMLIGRPPWDSGSAAWINRVWTDNDDRLCAEWLQHEGISVTPRVVAEAAETVAQERSFHPVREFVESHRWDEVPRLDEWLTNYLGVPDDPYTRAVGAKWMISAIARIYVPGIKADCMLILEGEQGIRKSSALQALAGPWFADRLSDLDKKDAAIELSGIWILELAELDGMSRSESGTIKAFLSRSTDHFRPPWARRAIDVPRQCVFAGTVNPEGGYLKDPTGGRRFWPVRCSHITLDSLIADRGQLWAEARERFKGGEQWWLDTPELLAMAAERQRDRYQGDPWEELIDRYLAGSDRFGPVDDTSIGEILREAIVLEAGRWNQAEQNRVVRCLVDRGFAKYRAVRGDRRESRYRVAKTIQE